MCTVLRRDVLFQKDAAGGLTGSEEYCLILAHRHVAESAARKTPHATVWGRRNELYLAGDEREGAQGTGGSTSSLLVPLFMAHGLLGYVPSRILTIEPMYLVWGGKHNNLDLFFKSHRIHPTSLNRVF